MLLSVEDVLIIQNHKQGIKKYLLKLCNRVVRVITNQSHLKQILLPILVILRLDQRVSTCFNSNLNKQSLLLSVSFLNLIL